LLTSTGPAKEFIQVSQQRFTGGAAFDENGNMFIANPGSPFFIGDTALHPEIDYNWDNLTWGKSKLL
jgi:protein associated with RNAse G/E